MLSGLNERQIEAVKHIDGPCLVIAGAGSGKTKVLTTRIAYLMENGISDYNILAITFTNKAAKEMRERLNVLVPDNHVFVGTFHSFGLKIIRENLESLGMSNNFTILDSEDILSLIKKIMKELNIDAKEVSPYYVRNKISFIKNELLTQSDIEKFFVTAIEKEVVPIYQEYEKVLRRNNSVDFDDLLSLPVKLFRENKDILEKYQEHYKYILIDEYQDTNEVQYVLSKLLGEKYRNIFVVGDVNQCLLPGTKIVTSKGIKAIENINEGDLVLSGVGFGKTNFETIEKVIASNYEGKALKITTKTGKEIDCTSEHMMFYKLPMEMNKFYVYLMYKKDLGFRIGQTRSYRTERANTLVNGLKQRLNQEHADKIWLLKRCDNQIEANYYEQYYASNYGIPQMVFYAEGRKILFKKEDIERFYKSIPTVLRASMLMYDEGLSMDYPHYSKSGFTRKSVSNRIININYLSCEKALKRSYHAQRISFNTTSLEYRTLLENAGFKVRNGKNKDFRIETERIGMDEAYLFATKIAQFIPDVSIIEKIRLSEGEAFKFLPAASLREGMLIPIFDGKNIIEDEIVKMESYNYKGTVYDLSIPTTRNYLANNISVHNCIYAFRGANFRNILNFEKDYKDTHVVRLEQNYRSTKNILEAANSVIKNNKERKDMELFSELGEGVKVKYLRSYDEKHEISLIVDEIKTLLNEGYDYKDIAIFYRTNAQSRIVEEVLLKNNIPYKVVGSYYFYNRKEIKDLLCYLRLINNTADDISLRRVINVPKRKIGPRSILAIEQKARSLNVSMFDAIDEGKELEFKNLILELRKDALNLSLTELIDDVLEKSGMKEELEKEKILENEFRLENLMEFKSITASFEARTGSVNLGDFLDEISLIADVSDHQEDDDVLTIMTLHSAKGLEFPIVFITGMEEGIFPHSNAFLDGDEGIEEERRLCYVGFTRAKEKLYLTNAKKRMLYGKSTVNIPSRFINEVKKDCLEMSNLSIKEEKFVSKEAMYTDEVVDYKKGDLVMHTIYGKGVVTDVDDRFVTIAFAKNFGIRKLMKNHKGIKKL